MIFTKGLTLREKRKLRIRKKMSGVAGCPRLTVFKSNKFIYAQLIEDSAGSTIVQANSKELGLTPKSGKNIDAAMLVGKMVAERALAKGIKHVVFDRNGYLYHGKIKALADSSRSAGLEF